MTVTNLEAHAYTLEALRNKKGFICDMDGVIYHATACCRAWRSSSNGCTMKTRNTCS